MSFPEIVFFDSSGRKSLQHHWLRWQVGRSQMITQVGKSDVEDLG